MEVFVMDMTRSDLEDEVMVLRAQNQNLILAYQAAQKELLEKDNEMMSLRRQLAALTCACCDPPTAEVNAGAPLPHHIEDYRKWR